MKIITRLLFLCCIAFLTMQCGNPEQRKPQTTETLINKAAADTPVKTPVQQSEPAVETKTVETSDKISQQKASDEFSIFIPASGNQNNKLPVILFFDPHASGKLPVEMYKALAEEFGFILVGSNRSHNGQTINEAFEIFEKMKKEALLKYPVDASRIFVAGFSGGSRVVTAIGFKYPEIKSVIACGAGMGAVQKLPEPTFDYFGMIGNEDFNLNEMISTDRMLKRAGFNNAMVIFDGGHLWPPAEVMREAFWWLDLNAMNKKTLQTDQKIIGNALAWYKKEVNRLKIAGKFFDANLVAERAVKILKGLTDVAFFENEIQNLRTNPGYQKQLSEMVTTLQKEMGMQNSYINSMAEKDTTWWKTEIKHLQDSMVPKNDRQMNKRLLSYLGLISYMFSDRAVNEQNIEAAGKYLEIYRLLEPTNSEHFFLEAKRRMLMKDPVNAIAYLKLATIFGFSDYNRIINDPLFEPLKTNPDFKSLFR